MFNKSIFIIILLFSISLNCSSKIEKLFDPEKVAVFKSTSQVEVVQSFYDDCMDLEIIASKEGPYYLIYLLELVCNKLNSIEDKNSELYICLARLDQKISSRLSAIHNRRNRSCRLGL